MWPTMKSHARLLNSSSCGNIDGKVWVGWLLDKFSIDSLINGVLPKKQAIFLPKPSGVKRLPNIHKVISKKSLQTMNGGLARCKRSTQKMSSKTIDDNVSK